MLAGELYRAFEPQLTAERVAARRLLKAFNGADDDDARLAALKELLGGFDAADPPFIEPPFRCDYVRGGAGWFVGVGQQQMPVQSRPLRRSPFTLCHTTKPHTQGYNIKVGKNFYANFNAGTQAMLASAAARQRFYIRSQPTSSC
jgi:hypothetical protein